MEKEFLIKKRGRKYFQVGIGRWDAELVINELSQHLQVGDTVTLTVEDRSIYSQFGTKLRFEPASTSASPENPIFPVRGRPKKGLTYKLGEGEYVVFLKFSKSFRQQTEPPTTKKVFCCYGIYRKAYPEEIQAYQALEKMGFNSKKIEKFLKAQEPINNASFCSSWADA